MPDISEIVDVTITVQSAALTRKGFSSLMIVGSGDDFSGGFLDYEVRKYVTAAQIGEDTDILDGEAKNMAIAAFAQSPSVASVYLSKIELASTPFVLSADGDQTGTLYTTDPGTVFLDFNGTNSAITPTPDSPTGNITMVDGAGDTWNFDYNSYAQAGPESYRWQGILNVTKNGAPEVNLASFVDVPDPTNISLIQLSVTVVEITSDDLDAIAENNNDWFGYSHVFHDSANNLVASNWVASNKKYGFFRTYDTTGVNIAALNSSFSCGWFSATAYQGTVGDCVEAAVASALLARVPGSYTAAFKSLELITPTSPSNESALRTNKCNQYSEINQRAITWDGVTSGQGFIDTYIGVLYLEARIGEDVFGYMASQNKVPYTNPGIDGIVSQVQRRLDQSVEEGYLTNDPQPVASAPRVTEISATDKSNRYLPNVTFIATTAGAIHTVQINGTLIA